jgi:hypothetical protein
MSDVIGRHSELKLSMSIMMSVECFLNYADYHCVKCHYAECQYAECCHAESRGADTATKKKK